MEYVPTFNIKNKRMNVGKKNPYMDRMGPFISSLLITCSLDWFKGKITGNHGFYHQI